MAEQVSQEAGSAASEMSVRAHIHSTVETASDFLWNNQYDEASAILKAKKDTNPRYAIEWANIALVKTLMSSRNAEREALLDLYKAADTLATSCKYAAPMFSDDDDDDVTDTATDNASSVASPTQDSRSGKSNRKKEKKAFKKAKKSAAKSGETFDNAWKLECDVVYADCLMLRAIVQLMMNSFLKGGLNMRKAWGCYRSLLGQVEKDVEGHIPYELHMSIKFGVGTFYAFLALVPANLMKLLSIVGFVSDKDLGEQYLTETFYSDTIRSPFAGLLLCTLYLFLPTGLGNVEVSLAKAKRVLDRMNSRYPNNTYFHGYANFYHRKRGETAEAVREITLAADNGERAGLTPLLIKYLLADTLFMDQQWQAALDGYTRLLDYLDKTKEKFAYNGQVVLSAAACYVMVGDDKKAMEYIKKVGVMYNQKSKNDSNAPKFASRVIANPRLLPLSAVYMLYINRDLAHMNKQQGTRVLAELKRVTDGKDLSGPEAENMMNLFIGVIQKGCENTDEAFAYMQKIFDNEKSISQESMILPFTYYETGEMEFRRDNFERAKELFDKGSKIKGDGNETLSNRFSIAQKQLRKTVEAQS